MQYNEEAKDDLIENKFDKLKSIEGRSDSRLSNSSSEKFSRISCDDIENEDVVV
jgi:hypothetical protein